MSSKKGSDVGKSTLVEIDDNLDSGFLSGPISEQLTSNDECETSDEPSSKNDEVKCVEEDCPELDSGLCLSEELPSVKFSESATGVHLQTTPAITISSNIKSNVLPLAQIFDQDEEGDTQLHIAAARGCEKSVGLLLRISPGKAWLDAQNYDYRQSALHLAVITRHAVITRMLVIAGASIEVRDIKGETPLHIAATLGDVKCIHALLNPVPEQLTKKLATVLKQRDYNGQTCVHASVLAGNVEALQALVFYGADINAQDGLSGRTALHFAGVLGNVPMCEYLLRRCKGVTPVMDWAGRSPRSTAARTVSHLFAHLPADDVDTDDEDDDLYDEEDGISLFDKMSEGMSGIKISATS